MRTLVYHVATTLDGFIADIEHGVSAFPTEGDHIPEYLAALKSYEAVVMGRKTYDRRALRRQRRRRPSAPHRLHARRRALDGGDARLRR